MNANPNPKSGPHKIYIYDNFDWEEGRDFAGEAATAEEAESMAKRIIDISLDHERSQAKDPHNADEVFDRWDSFGNFPSISPPLVPNFDCVAYAREQAEAMAAQPAVRQHPERLMPGPLFTTPEPHCPPPELTTDGDDGSVASRMKEETKANKTAPRKPTGRAGMTPEERKAATAQGKAEWKAKHGDKPPKVH